MLCFLGKMLKNLKSYLKKEIKGLDLTEVVDILLFGSAVKGKEFPKDIDICIIFRKNRVQNIVGELTKRIKKINLHISTLTTDNFFRKPHSLIKTLLVEGISILTDKKFSQNFGFSSTVLYSYNLSKLKQSDKVRFVYLLKGRKDEGIVKKLNGEWIADSCFIIPIEKDSGILAIFKKWFIQYKRKEVLLH